MALLLHYTGQDYVSRGLLNTELTPGSTSAIVGGCKTGKGFEFDGTVDSALYVNNIGTPMPTEFTISCWAKVDDIVGVKTIWTNGGLFNSGFAIDISNNKIRAFSYNTSGIYTATETNSGFVEINKWYHIVAGIRNNKVFLYVDKVFIKELSISGTIRTEFEPIIGYRFSGAPFNGQICNFKYYNHVLSAREIAEDYKSLMLHYKLDKPITDTVYDVSGFQRHIAVIQNTTTNSTTEKRVYGGSLANDGTKRLYGTCDLSDLNGLSEISFSIRTKWNSTTGLHGNFIIRTAPTAGFGISFFRNGSSVICDIGSRLTYIHTVTGSWIDYVFTKTPTEIKMYINGVLASTLASTTALADIGSRFFIACVGSDTDKGSNFLNGNVQDIRFYATALTEQDVKELYQTRHMVDKSSNCYTYELIEGQTTVGMNKQGQLLCDEIIENEDGSFQIVSNKTIKTKEIKEI